MNILITGSKGFIGRNLIEKLSKESKYNIITFDADDSIQKIYKNVDNVDCIVHLAGVCRTTKKENFIETNVGLTEELVPLVKNKNIPFVFSSSIQATLDNDYGKSKLIAEETVSTLGVNGFILRFHNIFGKWAKENHHSVVANFCYNAVRNLPLRIDNPNVEIEFIYIDDVIELIMSIINSKIKNPCKPIYVEKRYKVKIGDLASIITSFSSGFIPSPEEEFLEKLYITYNNYLEEYKNNI